MRNKIAGIYQIKNLITNKIYIGSSNDILKRFIAHKNLLICNKHDNIHLQRAWNIDGKENFQFSVKEVINNLENILNIEQKYLDALDKNNAYNIHYIAFKPPSPKGRILSESTKLLIKSKRLGTKLSDETCAKISKSRKGIASFAGHKHTDSAKVKMALAKAGKPGNRLGHKSSISTRLKLSASHKGLQSNNMKSILIDGIVYKSIYYASQVLNIKYSTIRNRLGRDNKKYTGYKYV